MLTVLSKKNCVKLQNIGKWSELSSSSIVMPEDIKSEFERTISMVDECGICVDEFG